MRIAIVLAIFAMPALALAQGASPDVPPQASAANDPHLVYPGEAYALGHQSDDDQRSETYYAVGAGTLTLGYLASAGTAMFGEFTNTVGCGIGDVVGAVSGKPSGAPCPSTGTTVLYIPVAGPALFFTEHDRIHNLGFDAMVIADGATQLLGIGLIIGGLVTQNSESSDASSPALRMGSLQLKLLPSAPGALAGARLRLDF